MSPSYETDMFSCHPFWQFSLQIIEKNLVKQSLEILTARLFHKSLLLYCLWHAKTGRGVLTQMHLQDLFIAINFWHTHIVVPLEQLHRRTTRLQKLESLWGALESMEQTSQQIEQLMLTECFARPSEALRTLERRCKDAHYSLLAYRKVRRIPSDKEIQRAFALLLAATFPDVPMSDIQSICSISQPLPLPQNGHQGPLF